tara:strand:+ start:521 stop:1381 length:861 start_codon:yes stop_codon:yes gene_type:complete
LRYKLPVFATIADAYRFLGREFGAWFRLAIVPLIIWVVIDASVQLGFLSGGLFGLQSDHAILAYTLLNAPFVVVYLITVIILFMYAVALHRLVLIGPGSVPGLSWVAWHARHWRYLGRGLVTASVFVIAFIISATFVPAIGTAAGTAGILESAAGQVTLTVIVLLLFAVPTALLTCMTLPALSAAAADDDAVDMAEASNQARGNLWRMTFVFGLGLLLPFWLIEVAVRTVGDTVIATDGPSAGPELLVTTALLIVNFVGFTAGVALLSAIFRRLRDNVPLRSDVPR